MLDQMTSTYLAVEVILYLPWYDILSLSLKIILRVHVGSHLRLCIGEFT